MRTIVHDSGISQRRCERAIALLKQAGFMREQQPRMRSEKGAYFGCRVMAGARPIFKHRQGGKSREQRIAIGNATWASHVRIGRDAPEAQRRTNETLG